MGALEFMKKVYATFGMTYRLERSTRPAKASGLDTPEGVALWDLAEAQLAEALDSFQGPGWWSCRYSCWLSEHYLFDALIK